MKLLLFDQNISPHLVDRLADIYPNSVHVFSLGLGNAMDIEIWQYARDHDYMIVTKDADFSEFGIVKRFPFVAEIVRPVILKTFCGIISRPSAT